MSKASDWLKEVKEVVEEGRDIAPEISNNLSIHLGSYETVLEILNRDPEEVTKVMNLLASVTGSQPMPTPTIAPVAAPVPSQPSEIDPLVALAVGQTPSGLGGDTPASNAALSNWIQTNNIDTNNYDEADLKATGMRSSGSAGERAQGAGNPQKLSRRVE
tara:strand:+ start:577 stop:1056 length:480 start_codon:yes stop_codon:yes gene_type:complete